MAQVTTTEISEAESKLYDAHERVLRDAVDLVDRARVPVKTIGDRMIMLLAGRVLQIGRAINRLCRAGHAGEAGPLARAAISACVILAYIAEDRDGRSIAYIEEDRRVRRKRIADLEREKQKAADAGKEFFVSDQEMEAIVARSAEVVAMEGQKLAALGIQATKLGNADTWTGLANERDLFDQMNVLRWYVTFYKVFSDESHINANSLAGELGEQLTGTVAIGPKFGDPLTIHVIKASAEAALQAIDQVIMAFNVPDAHKINQMFGAAITDYAKAIATSSAGEQS